MTFKLAAGVTLALLGIGLVAGAVQAQAPAGPPPDEFSWDHTRSGWLVNNA